MDVKELRIGNLFRQTKDKEPKEVISIDYMVDLDNDKEGYIVNSSWLDEFEPIPLTEGILLKCGFDNWGNGNLYVNNNEKYTRHVIYNGIDGSSNFEVHYITSTYEGIINNEYVVSIDENERVHVFYELKHLHQLQNLYFALTGQELTINL